MLKRFEFIRAVRRALGCIPMVIGGLDIPRSSGNVIYRNICELRSVDLRTVEGWLSAETLLEEAWQYYQEEMNQRCLDAIARDKVGERYQGISHPS